MKILFQHITQILHIVSYCAPKMRMRAVFSPENTETIEIVTGGSVRYKGGIHGRGRIFWHLPGERLIGQESTGAEPFSCCAFSFRVSGSERIAPEISTWPSEIPFDCDELFQDAERLFHDPSIDRDFLTLYIYSQLYRCAAFPEKSSVSASRSAVMVEILRSIRYSSMLNIPVRKLAEINKISVSGLFALFARELHISPHQYLILEKIKRAKTLLAGNVSIKEAADRCGFKNPETFARIFKKNEGFTPGEYRKSHHYPSDDPPERESQAPRAIPMRESDASGSERPSGKPALPPRRKSTAGSVDANGGAEC